MTQVIDVGLVGAGPWAQQFHAPMLAAAERLHLSVVWARRRDAAQELALRYGVAVADSYDDLLARCDAVVFAVPPQVQAILAPRAARAGRHVLLEKPLATTVSGAEAIVAAVDAASVASQVMLTNRYTDRVRRYLASLSSDDPVRYVRVGYLSGGALPGSPFATPWRRAERAVLLDIGPHTLDLAAAIAGPVVQVQAVDVHGLLSISTVHEAGAVGHVAMSITTPGAPGGSHVEAVTDGGWHPMPEGEPEAPDRLWRNVTDEFHAAVTGQEPQPLDAHHGLVLQRVLAAVDRAVDTGQAQRVARSAR